LEGYYYIYTHPAMHTGERPTHMLCSVDMVGAGRSDWKLYTLLHNKNLCTQFKTMDVTIKFSTLVDSDSQAIVVKLNIL